MKYIDTYIFPIIFCAQISSSADALTLISDNEFRFQKKKNKEIDYPRAPKIIIVEETAESILAIRKSEPRCSRKNIKCVENTDSTLAYPKIVNDTLL